MRPCIVRQGAVAQALRQRHLQQIAAQDRRRARPAGRHRPGRPDATRRRDAPAAPPRPRRPRRRSPPPARRARSAGRRGPRPPARRSAPEAARALQRRGAQQVEQRHQRAVAGEAVRSRSRSRRLPCAPSACASATASPASRAACSSAIEGGRASVPRSRSIASSSAWRWRIAWPARGRTRPVGRSPPCAPTTGACAGQCDERIERLRIVRRRLGVHRGRGPLA